MVYSLDPANNRAIGDGESVYLHSLLRKISGEMAADKAISTGYHNTSHHLTTQVRIDLSIHFGRNIIPCEPNTSPGDSLLNSFGDMPPRSPAKGSL